MASRVRRRAIQDESVSERPSDQDADGRGAAEAVARLEALQDEMAKSEAGSGDVVAEGGRREAASNKADQRGGDPTRLDQRLRALCVAS